MVDRISDVLYEPPLFFMQWHHVELIHFDLLRILHWAETDMDEEVTELISVRAPGRSIKV